MRVVSSILSIHSSDTAGVCSSLYELGGMTVVHDASGCNSTYATHDEPRWYAYGSRTYISALTESDVIMGNDERFIDNVSQSASEFPECRFIAICGSPLPLMVGTDFAALGREIESRTGLPVLALNTNGISSYLAGVNELFPQCTKSFSNARALEMHLNSHSGKCSRRPVLSLHTYTCTFVHIVHTFIHMSLPAIKSKLNLLNQIVITFCHVQSVYSVQRTWVSILF